uniref:Nose resistant-to-fluoxetine protein N-terminal domain-containing protein n=1 Tax=Trichobilharzia regenti TaxID=157069 RepID=A0AA85JL10_TRIRE|nr:unnamed protein product [Trichobilharzia regenti]
MMGKTQQSWLLWSILSLFYYQCNAKDHITALVKNQYFHNTFDKKYDDFVNSLNHLIANNVYNNLTLPAKESTCSKDLRHLINGIFQRKIWALQWLDASVHPPPGITGGAMHWMGSYDVCLECKGYNSSGEEQFRGSYCTMVFFLNISVPVVPELSATVGLCMPNSCSSEEVRNIVNATSYLFFAEMLQNESFCHRPVSEVNKDAWYYIAVSICSILVIFVIAGTITDLCFYIKWFREKQSIREYTRLNHTHETNLNENSNVNEEYSQHFSESDSRIVYHENQSRSGEKDSESFMAYRKYMLQTYPQFNILCAFSLPVNSVKLCAKRIQESTEMFDERRKKISLEFLDGIRVISMIWIITGHILLHGYKLTNNLKSLAEAFQHVWIFGIYFNAHLAPDTYFFISGLLMCYMCLQRLKNVVGVKKRIKFWSMMALHRFVRLTPAYLLVIIIFTGLLIHVYDGPFFPQDLNTTVMANCRKNWYILYLNNLINSESMCLNWSWYIANDIQFTIILAPIFITLIMWRRLAGIILALSIIISSSVITYCVAYDNSYGIMQIAKQEIYIRPYARCGTYTIGLLTGWLLYDYPRLRIRKVLKHQILIGACSLLLIACLCILPIFGSYGVLSGLLPDMPRRTAAFYLASERVSFGLGLAILVYLCAIGWANPIYKCFAWSAFRVPARLTYCAYLIHPVIVTIFIDGTQSPFIIDQLKTVQLTASITVFSYFFAYIISMMVEYPSVAIENYLRG